jgi:hypothetical protein
MKPETSADRDVTLRHEPPAHGQPTFTVLIGTIGRPSLRHTLDAIARQPRVEGDQVLVAIDSHQIDAAETPHELEGRMRRIEALVASYGPGFEVYQHDSGYHWFGIEQINHVLRTRPITGTHVFTMGDDDVFVDDAYATLRPLCADDPGRPILYRFLAPWRELLWDQPRMQISRISGCCIAAPVHAVGLFPTRKYVEHDYDWMLDILERSGRDPLWLDRTLVIARPDARGDDVTHRGIVRCWACHQWAYREDVTLRTTTCARCRVVLQPNEVLALA